MAIQPGGMQRYRPLRPTRTTASGGAMMDESSTAIPGTPPTEPHPTAVPPGPPPVPGTPPGPPEPPGPPPTQIPPPALPPTVTPPTTPPAIAPITSPVGNALRGDTYLPGDDPRLKGAMSATDAAAGKVQGYKRSDVQSGNEDRYRSIYGNGQVNADPSLTGAPDRTALAKQAFADFMSQQQEQQFNEERGLGRNIAKFGRSGLQANAGDFGEIQRKIAGDRSRYANELARDVSEGDINDRFRKLDFQTGLDERNQDRDFTRKNAAINTATNQTDAGIGDLYDQFNNAGSLEDRVFGQGQSNRNEYRTERGREDTQAQNTIENRLKEYEITQQLEDARIRRAAALAQAGGQY